MSRVKVVRVLLQVVLVMAILSPRYFFARGVILENQYYLYVSYFTLVSAFIHFTNVFLLVPKVLKRRKYWQYLLLVIGLLVLYGFCVNLIQPYPDPKIVFTGPDGNVLSFNLNRHAAPMYMPIFTLTFTGLALEILFDWDDQKRQIEATNKEKIQAELQFLKSQINPHFFFNTLNSIYSLAVSKSEKTEKAILLLSNLMRYVLDQSAQQKIEIGKEVDFLNDYIELQKLRMSSDFKAEVDFCCDIKDLKMVKIEPMLLIPLVENAFKYSKSFIATPFIGIKLSHSKNGTINFSVENTVGEVSQTIKESFGIGLENIRKRLQLSYMNAHRLSVEEKNGNFFVKLSLELK